MDNLITELPQGLRTFRENYKRKYGKYPDGHNMYVLESYDLDGNKTCEAYGLNVLTNAGMTYCFSNTSGGYLHQRNLYIGSGTTDPTPTDTSIETPITTAAATEIEHTFVRYPMEYDPATDTISQSAYVYSGYFDYNLTGVTEDKEIHELGMGTSATVLYTHAKVYDINVDGVTTPIKKKMNEKLVIKVFLSASYKVGTTISDLYDKGVYLIFEPSIFLKQTCNDEPNIFTSYQRRYKSSGILSTAKDLNIWSNSFMCRYSDVADNVATKDIKSGDLILSNDGAYLSRIVTLNNAHVSGIYTRSYYPYNDNTLLLIEGSKSGVKLPQAEELVLENIYTTSAANASIYSPGAVYCDGSTRTEYMDISLTEGSGGSGVFSYIPVTQMDIKSCNMYNHETKEWDISETVQNNAAYDYDAEAWEYYGELLMQTPIGAKQVEVYVNMQAEYPITSISVSTEGSVIYATDKYWDSSTWTLIDDIAKIPTELQKKRYYINILGSTHVNLKPNYNCTKHAIVPTTQSKNISISGSEAGCKTLSNDTLCYVVTYDRIVFPDGSTITGYPLTAHGGNTSISRYRWNTKDGSRILILSSDQTKWNNEMLRVYTITDSTTAPTFHDVTLTFTGSTDQSKNLRTFSSNGWYCSQNLTTKTCVVLNLVGGVDGVPTQYELTNVRYCYALDFTDNCVYLADDSNGLKFEIYDMKNKTVLGGFVLDSTYTFMGICGWNNIVYVRTKMSDGSFVTFSYAYETDTLGRVENVDIPNMNIPNSAEINSRDNQNNYMSTYYPLTSPDCMVIYQNMDIYNPGQSIYAFLKSDPDHPIKVLSIDDGSYGSLTGSVHYIEKYSCLFTGIYQSDDNKHLYLYGPGLYNSSWFGAKYNDPRVVDLGYIMDTRKAEPPYPCGRGKQYLNSSSGVDYVTYNPPGVCMYKGQVLCQRRTTEDGLSKIFSFLPIENFVPHKLVIETTTIQSYNNPKRIRSTRSHKFRVTNDLSKWA